jgi:hypothetical protein
MDTIGGPHDDISVTRKRRLAAAAVLVGLAWIADGRDGIELVSWLAGIGAFLLAAEAADIVRARDAGPTNPASSRSAAEISAHEEAREPTTTPDATSTHCSGPSRHHHPDGDPTDPASSGNPADAVDQVGPEDRTCQPESVVRIPPTDGPGRASPVRNALGAAVGLVSLVSFVAMVAWILTSGGPRGTEEVTCAVGICTVR